MEEIKAGYENVRLQDGLGNKITSVGGALAVSAVVNEVAVAEPGDPMPTDVKVIGGNDSGTVRALSVDATGKLLVSGGSSLEGVIDANNTTSTPLAGGATYTGSWTEITTYNSINLGVYSDVGSATDGLKVQYSADGVTVHHEHFWTFPGGSSGVGYQLSSEFRYFRIEYVNGASAQSVFQLVSNLKPTSLAPSSYRASSTFSDESQVNLTKGVIVGKTSAGGGGYVSVKVNPSGALTVESDVTSSVLPTGASTEATLATIATAINGRGQPDTFTGCIVPGFVNSSSTNVFAFIGDSFDRPMVGAAITDTTGSLAATVASGRLSVDGSGVTQPVSAASLPLPAGAATESTLDSVKTAVELIDDAIGTNSSTAPGKSILIGGKTTGGNIVPFLTDATGQMNTVTYQLPSVLGQTDKTQSLSVVLASDQGSVPVTQSGLSSVGIARSDYSTTSVTTSAYVELIASTSAASSQLEIFDSSGQTLVLAFGGAGSEVDKIYITPGGNGIVPLTIPSGTRLSIKAVSATASEGEITINLYG